MFANVPSDVSPIAIGWKNSLEHLKMRMVINKQEKR